MFTKPIFGNFFQPFTAGFSPLTVGTGFSGMTPFLLQQPQLIGASGGFSPLPPQFVGYGVTPYNVAPGAGILPVPTSSFGAIPTPVINPLGLSQVPAVNPTILPNLVPQMWGGPPTQGWINPAFQLLNGEANYLGLSPFSSQFGWSTVSPYMAQEPIVNTLLAQQLNPLAQQRLPIRSLVNSPQIDPYQAGIAGVPGSVINQAIDPYSLLAQAQFMPQLGAIPIQQIGRAFTSANWFVPPYSMGQTIPMAQVGVPIGI